MVSKNLLYRRISVPIFEAHVRLIVTYQVKAARLRFNHLLGEWKNPVDHCLALSSFAEDRAEGALFFHPAGLTFNTVAHEIFHLSHNILAYRSVPFRQNEQETHALLNGWLTEQIMPALNKYKPLT